MVMALPAGILLLIYVFFVASPASKEMETLQRRVSLAQSQAPSSPVQAEVLSELKRLEAEIGKKRSAVQERGNRSDSVLAFWNDPDAKAESGEFIGNVLASNGVVLVEEAIASDEDKKAFEALLEPLPSAELWKLRLAGSYKAVRQTVSEMGKTELPLIPAGIEMEPKVEGNQTIHLWNLWICR